jgi:hypothetical protein
MPTSGVAGARADVRVADTSKDGDAMRLDAPLSSASCARRRSSAFSTIPTCDRPAQAMTSRSSPMDRRATSMARLLRAPAATEHRDPRCCKFYAAATPLQCSLPYMYMCSYVNCSCVHLHGGFRSARSAPRTAPTDKSSDKSTGKSPGAACPALVMLSSLALQASMYDERFVYYLRAGKDNM